MKPVLIIMLAAANVFAATLEWDRNPEPEVGRYNVWLESTNGIQLLGTTTNLSFVSTNITTRSRVGVSAVSTNGFESEIAWGDNPSRPLRIRLTLQSSSDLPGPFGDVTNVLADIGFVPSAFYRGKLTIENN